MAAIFDARYLDPLTGGPGVRPNGAEDTTETRVKQAPDTPWKEEQLTGTTIMAVSYGEGLEGGVVIGADSRTSTGTYVANRATDKLDQVADRIFVQRSGSSADTEAVADMVRYYLKINEVEVGQEPAVATAANLLKDIIYNNKDRLCAGMMVAGWDPYKGGSVFHISVYAGSLVKEKWAIGGSGSSYIYGLCDNEYKEGMTAEEARAFVIKGLGAAMARDGSSGGCVRLCTINKTGAHREFVPNAQPLPTGAGLKKDFDPFA